MGQTEIYLGRIRIGSGERVTRLLSRAGGWSCGLCTVVFLQLAPWELVALGGEGVAHGGARGLGAHCSP